MADQNQPQDPNKKPIAGVQPQQAATPAPAYQPQPAVAQVGGPPRGSQQIRATHAAGPAKTTGFAGAGRFLQANVGSQLGQRVAGQITQAGQQAGSQLQQNVGQFQAGLGQAQAQYQQNLAAGKAALGNIATGQPAGTVVAQPVQQQAKEAAPVQLAQDAMAQPLAPVSTQVTPTSDQALAYQAAVAGQYAGPTGLQDVQGIQDQIARAQALGASTQTTAGRIAALQQMLGRGSRQYTAGQSALDALILGQSGQQLATARRNIAGLGQAEQTQEALATQQAKQAGAEIAGKGKELAQQAGAMEAKTVSDISAQKAAYEKGLGDIYNKVTQEVASGELSQESLDALKNLGIDENSQFYGLKPAEIANLITRKQPGEITSATSASAEQLRKINAIKQLAGDPAQFSEEDIKKAGTTVDPRTGLATSQSLKDLISKQKESFEKELGGLVSSGEMQQIQDYAAEQKRVEQVNQERQARVAQANQAEQARQQRYKAAIAAGKYPDEKDLEPIKPNPQDLVKEVNTRGGGAFAYSPGRGNTAINAELLQKFASGELYDKDTGKLNVDLANQLKSFWGWRPEYKGRSGFLGTGAGRYDRYAGDAARVSALEDLINRYGTGKTFKTKAKPE